MAILTPAAMARRAAATVVAVLRLALAGRGRAVLLPSAGRTPLATYAELRTRHQASLDWSRVVCVQMDEYAGLGSDDPRSFAALLRRELVQPLGIGRFLHLLGKDGQLLHDLPTYERLVLSGGGIDCALHGLGRNGHVAFNEPGDAAAAATRVVTLASATRMANQVSFSTGVTLGLRALAAADTSLVLALGAAKRQAMTKWLFEPPGPQHPAAGLRHCRATLTLMDDAAAPAALGLPRGEDGPRL